MNWSKDLPRCYRIIGGQNTLFDLTRDTFGIVKRKSQIDRHSKGTERFYRQNKSLSTAVQLSHPRWTDSIMCVRKLDNIVWSNASWDIWNSPLSLYPRFMLSIQHVSIVVHNLWKKCIRYFYSQCAFSNVGHIWLMSSSRCWDGRWCP